ncbi:MAG: insulinase family protein [Ignavibacteriae bacterium]|nr:insulinase family protein [Ignavibacteria bacterium]MBI3363529.1 insulinase family protein [Ignavibacteriota bacterium]
MKRLALLLALLLNVSRLSISQTTLSVTDKLASDAQKNLPVDTAITTGKLDNGLTYYIKANKKPEKRAELRLVVKAGSILEDDDQRGLAHFCEHMAFNGTLNFKKNELINYLESIGMRFGADVNAYTSFDETVYMLQIPTDTPSVVEKSFDILEDWAHLVSFDDDEIEKERGVVIEEWRLGRGAAARMRDKQFPILFKDSRYAERLPIGQKSILDSFRHETLRRFYRSWYRPDLMAVVAVGDFEKPEIEKLIKKHFSGIESLRAKKERVYYPVPDHDETLYSIATDSEATLSSVSIDWLRAVDSGNTERDYRRSLVEGMYNSMLNDRLNELTKKPDPPFLFASSSNGRLVRTKSDYGLEAGVKDNGILRGMEAILAEAYRVRKFGFTQSELDRQKKEMLRGIERTYAERDKTESSSFAAEYIRNFLTNESIPGIAFEYALYKKYVPTIVLEEVNQLASTWMVDKNRVVLVNAPAKSGVAAPKQEELSAVFDSVVKRDIQPYTENIANVPLVDELPHPGTIRDESRIPELGVTQWDLSNGIRVVLKPTDFKNDEVIFTAFSPGGTSLVPDSNYIPAITAASIIDQGGLGKFDEITLQKMLSGKIAGASPFIGEMEEGLSGGASPQDLETMFQLIYLSFTAPRMDSSAFLAYQSRIRGYLQNRNARPESAFDDTIQVTMGQYNPRRQPWSEALFDKMDLRKSYAIYRDRFSDASDFTFVFVGNFSPDSIKPFITTYLGSLPATHRGENWKDLGINPPNGVIEKTVKKGMEPKSRVRILFTGNFIWSQENRYFLNSLTSAMTIKLREVLREEKGGTYGVGVSATFERDPLPQYEIGIGFGCAPERVDELTKLAFAVIDSVKRFGIDSSYVQKVKETQRRERETSLKQNRFWLSNLQFYYDMGEDPRRILNYERLVETLRPMHLQQAAQYFFDMNNYVKVVLMPKE